MSAAFVPTFEAPPPSQKGNNYILDNNYVTTTPQGTTQTGCYRPYSTLDCYPSAAVISAPTGNAVGVTTLTSGMVMAANQNRILLAFQPINSGAYLLLGTGNVSPTSFHVFVPSGTSYFDNSWKGALSAYISGNFSLYQTS